MNKWIAVFDLEDGDTMPEHMDLNYIGATIDFHCRPMWIPCSERLPEKHGYYLVTTHHAIPPYHMFHPENDIYADDISIQKFDGKFIDSVVAWMPLPEPYKEEEEEQ